jgi:hypothetical protein
MKAGFKVISALVAIVMILSLASVTVLATDTEAPVREVRIYPSSEHPVFVLTDTEDVSYEWYVLPEGGARVTDTDATARAGAEYSDGAWHAGFNPETNEAVFFDIELEAGDIIMLEHGDGPTCDDYALFLDDRYSYFDAVDGETSYAEIGETGTYRLVANLVYENTPIKAYAYRVSDGVKLEGETTDTLGDYDIGRYYYAKAIYGDGEVLYSHTFLMRYSITSQPHGADVSVGTNRDEDVSEYRWYSFDPEKEYTAAMNTAWCDVTVYDAQFKDGLWLGSYINIQVDGLYGDVLYVEPDEGFSGTVELFATDEQFETDDDGRYYYEFNKENGTSADFEINTYSGSLSFDIYIMRGGKRIDVLPPRGGVINEDKMELYADEYWNCHYDMDKWVGEGGNVILYVTVNFDVAAIRIEADGSSSVYDVNQYEEPLEPTGEGLFYVERGEYEINVDVFGVEPFANIFLIVGDKEYEIVMSRRNVYDDESGTVTVGGVDNGTFKDGVWYSDEEYTEIDLSMDIDEGEILTVVTSEEFDGRVTLDVSNAGGLEIELVGEGGVYSFVADKYYKFDLELEYSTRSFTAEVKVKRGSSTLLPGKNEKRITLDRIGTYYAEVVFGDGTVLRSGAAECFSCDHSANGNPLHCTDTTECTVCDIELGARGHVFGEWRLISHPTLDEGGEEMRVCSACGESETRTTAKLDGASPAVIFIIIGACAAASGAALVIAYLILKKKSGL